MTEIVSIPITAWDQPCSGGDQQRAIVALERGSVVLLPQLRFPLDAGEARLLSPALGGKGKNISFDGASGSLRGTSADAEEAKLLRGLMQRYASSSRALMRNLFPRYEAGLQQARTSFRPAEIAGRPSSWRKDDTRLHVDSFPSSPTGGRRILRVFTNVNPHGGRRVWRLGEPFDAVARRYVPTMPGPVWGSSRLLKMLHITKGPRTAYDHFMLRLHDGMKADLAYQAEAPQRVFEFEPGQSWIVYTDLVSHAAMSGQYAFEQTFHLPMDSMQEPAVAPLRMLERLLGRELV